MTSYYSTRPRKHHTPARLASLFIVRSGKTTASVEPRIDSPIVATLTRGQFFNGVWVHTGKLRWVRRINGGYVLDACVEELV